MKDLEMRLVSELMKNSRRSDRELAKVLGISQPTVSRMIQRLQKEGIVKAYSMIPDFAKLGFSLMAVTFIKTGTNMPPDTANVLVKAVREVERKRGSKIIMHVRGMGMGYDVMTVSVHESYSAYVEAIKEVREAASQRFEGVETFLADLHETKYDPLSMSKFADYLSIHTGRGF
jgi:DNA-binding Lrp family transcriptional regulator